MVLKGTYSIKVNCAPHKKMTPRAKTINLNKPGIHAPF